MQTSPSDTPLRPPVRLLFVATALTTLPALLGCGDATGPEGAGEVAVAFRTTGPDAAASLSGTSEIAASPDVRPSIQVSGTNGALTLETGHLVVADFELRRAGVSCDEAPDEDACEKFEGGPFFLELPMDGGRTVAVDRVVPPDSYSGLEFEVDDLEDDGEEDDDRAEQELLSSIREEFPEWPEDGSLRVTGTFTPDGSGEARSFTAYFEAEIEVEREFPSPLVIEEGSADRTVTVTLAPSVWFTRADGSIVDLTRFDFEETGRVGEFEVEIEDGVTEVEIEG